MVGHALSRQTPVVRINFVDDNMSRLRILVEHTREHRRRLPDQRCLLFGRNAFTGYLDVHVRHCCLLLFVSGWRSRSGRFQTVTTILPFWSLDSMYRWASAMASSRKVRVSGNFFAKNADAIVAATVAGLGVSLLPDCNMGTELRQKQLRVVLEDYDAIPATSPVYAVHAHQRHVPPKIRVFIEFLIETFPKARYL